MLGHTLITAFPMGLGAPPWGGRDHPIPITLRRLSLLLIVV
jgi:hypothetical protein